MAVMNEVTEVLHKIEAKLYPNYLGKGEGAYVARSKAEPCMEFRLCRNSEAIRFTELPICASAKNRGGFQ
jgi:hypothetical protein